MNRHRVEVYIIDEAGRIAASFERIQWDESEVLDRAAALLARDNASTAVQNSSSGGNENGFGKNSNTATTSYGTEFAGALASRPAPGLTSPALPATLSIFRLPRPSFQSAPSAGPHISAFSVLPAWSGCLTPPAFAPSCQPDVDHLGSLWLQQRWQQETAGFYLAATGAFLIFFSDRL